MNLELTKRELPKIEWNYNELKEILKKEIEKYDGLIVTEQTIPECKETQKKLASLKRKLDSARKEVKKELSAPISNFESEVKELISIISDVEDPIKDGLNIFEEKRKEMKLEEIKFLLSDAIDDAEELEQVVIPKELLNKTTTMKSINAFVETTAINIQSKLEDIEKNKKLLQNEISELNKEVDSDFTFEMFGFRKMDFLDLAGSLSVIKNRFRIVKSAEDQAKKKAEEKVENKQETPEIKVEEKPEAITSEKLNKVVDIYKEKTLKVYLNKEKWSKLIDFLTENNIKYKID